MISIKQEDFAENYELFAKLCDITSEPLKLVNANCKDMIVMTADAFQRRKKKLDLREKMLAADGDEELSTESTDFNKLRRIINELSKNEE
ncbi:hypothetical protein [Ruminococcus flavefaciens]|uniref:Prevent-host-death protein n=1 Tax=Ruminococcus flavefaciens 007c TaxID=1341157 RepID=W7UVA1_RUMFL|nr:hypothetical protein [Ruminococcus flavefaciens]EWM52750.1 hypothetical protein RF007C_14050 [Ruminococcus flavefaciens 007c]